MPRRWVVLAPMVLSVLFAFAAGSGPAAAQPAPPAMPRVHLAGVKPLPLTGARRAAFEAYVADALRRFGIVGASVAVVQGGEPVFLQGFGLKRLGGTDPVTADTLLAIGSTTKALTAMMAATVVDDGFMAWDTRVVDLLPQFAVADPALTPRITVADSLCMCTGVSGRTLPLFFTFDQLTPARMLASLAEMPLTAPFREQFQYSNQMFGVGGWAAAVAAGGDPNDLAAAYRLAMAERILGPIGMTRSTFTLEKVLEHGNVAYPHAAGPAGGLWSSARDMIRYMQTQLVLGVAPDGRRVVSAAHLQETRTARTPIPPVPGLPDLLNEASQGYALGWDVGTYKGQPLVNHSGTTGGFRSQVGFLPEAHVGVVILTNDAEAGTFTYDVEFRLFELLFDQPMEYHAIGEQAREESARAFAAERARVGQVDAAAVASYAGRYTNPVLDEARLAQRGGRLIFEAGGPETIIFADPPLAGPVSMALRRGTDGRPEMVLTARGDASAVRLGGSAAVMRSAGQRARPPPRSRDGIRPLATERDCPGALPFIFRPLLLEPLTAAIDLYRAMDMSLWLPQAEAALAQVERSEGR
jgi:CubicO group peptidase (beta-lactamase class C family)